MLIKSFVFFSFISMSFLTSAAYGSSYDDDMLEIVSKIIPRLVLMSSQKTSVQSQVDICVLYDRMDERDASLLVDKIRKNYPSGIKNYPIVLKKNVYENLDGCRNSQIAFMFDTDNRTIGNAVRTLNKNHTLSMSYDPSYLGSGVEVSLFFGRKVAPYINIGALRQNGIVLENTLIQISKIYTEGDGR